MGEGRSCPGSAGPRAGALLVFDVVDVQALAVDAQRPVGLDCAYRWGTVQRRDRGTAVVREAIVKKCVCQLLAKAGARDRAAAVSYA